MTEEIECRILDNDGRDLLGPVLVTLVHGAPVAPQWGGSFRVPRLKQLPVGEYRLCRVGGGESRIKVATVENGANVRFEGSGDPPAPNKSVSLDGGVGDLT